jgi:hypothetical protein
LDSYGVGISEGQIKELALTDEIKNDIIDAIESEESSQVLIGLFFAKNITVQQADIDFIDRVVSRSEKIYRNSKLQVQQSALSALIRFRHRVHGYRELMLSALIEDNPLVRRNALTAHSSFLEPKEFRPLERFEFDESIGEYRMGSYKSYDLRNLGFETIEKIVGATFVRIERSEIIKDNAVVFWWDWCSFHQWKRSNRRSCELRSIFYGLRKAFGRMR